MHRVKFKLLIQKKLKTEQYWLIYYIFLKLLLWKPCTLNW